MKTLIALGYHDQSSPHHWGMAEHFRAEGWEIAECHTDKRGFLPKMRDLWGKWKTLRASADAVLVTFPGHFLMPVVWLMTRWPFSGRSQRPQVIFDAFVSLFDSTVSDRGLVSPWHPRAWFLYAMDVLSCHMANRVLIDTQAHRRFFLSRFFLRPERVEVVYLTSRPDLFFPRTDPIASRSTFEVFFYGTYIPLQGVEHILQSQAIVEKEHPNARLTMVGGGQKSAEMRELAATLRLRSVTFIPFVPLEDLPRMIRNADLCLGVFGTTDKAARVIPHKVVDAVACGVPVLTRDSPAIRERYANHPLVLLCPPGNPQAIADVILRHATDALGTR